MPPTGRTILVSACLLSRLILAQETHEHPVPEKLGSVSFPTSCTSAVQKDFERGVALLHSFAYSAAKRAFQKVTENDRQCAIAHWGIAMTYFHQLWEPPLYAAVLPLGDQEVQRAREINTGSKRERDFIQALALIYRDHATVPYQTRALRYRSAMEKLAAANPGDTESQVFFALSLLAVAAPTDKTHANQKRAADVLEPLYRKYPDHPGIAHYLIHAYDSSELARRGEPAARAYAKIAPSAPHALHMPSHIFTRLGMWDDSIGSNLASKAAAHAQGDVGEELHAMDYLVYAYLQSGKDTEAADVLAQLDAMRNLRKADFKVGYAATAMRVRYALERRQWADAANIAPPTEAPPHVIALAVWCRALGLARMGKTAEASAEIEKLRQLEAQLRGSGNDYWAAQTGVQINEVLAWSAHAEGKPDVAVALLRKAADEEDAIEKLPVTPGPVIPAREQLGDLLLEQNQPKLALKEFALALNDAPGRRGALVGQARAAGQ